jgi:hypothetical protein
MNDDLTTISGRSKGKRLNTPLSLALFLQQFIDCTDSGGFNEHNLDNSVKSNNKQRTMRIHTVSQVSPFSSFSTFSANARSCSRRRSPSVAGTTTRTRILAR